MQRWKKLTKQHLQNFESEKFAHKMCGKNAQNRPKMSKNYIDAQKMPKPLKNHVKTKQKLAQL